MTLYRKKVRVYEGTFNAAMGAFGRWTLVPCTLDRKPLPAVAHQTEIVSPDTLELEWEAVPQNIGRAPDSALRQALWECPDCAFAFDGSHSNADGTYSCPNCAEAALRQALVAAEKGIRPLTKIEVPTILNNDEYVAMSGYGNRKLTAGEVRRAREAHAIITEALQRGEKT